MDHFTKLISTFTEQKISFVIELLFVGAVENLRM